GQGEADGSGPRGGVPGPGPTGSAGATAAEGMAVRDVGAAAVGVVGVGAGDVPPALRDRVELPAVEGGADPDEHARPAAAAVLRRAVAGAAQRLRVVALGGAGGPTAGLPAGGPQPTAAEGNVALAGGPRRGGVRPAPGRPVRTPYAGVTYSSKGR